MKINNTNINLIPAIYYNDIMEDTLVFDGCTININKVEMLNDDIVLNIDAEFTNDFLYKELHLDNNPLSPVLSSVIDYNKFIKDVILKETQKDYVINKCLKKLCVLVDSMNKRGIDIPKLHYRDKGDDYIDVLRKDICMLEAMIYGYHVSNRNNNIETTE